MVPLADRVVQLGVRQVDEHSRNFGGLMLAHDLENVLVDRVAHLVLLCLPVLELGGAEQLSDLRLVHLDVRLVD